MRGLPRTDAYSTLLSRWETHKQNRSDKPPRLTLPGGGGGASAGRAVQVVRTYGNPRTTIPLTVRRPENARHSIAEAARDAMAPGEFSFAPTGESSIHDLLVQAIRATRETIYVEDQYFVACKGMGGNEELLQALAETIARPTFKHMLVLTTGVGTVQGELHQTNRRRRELVERIASRFPNRISVWAYKGGQLRCSWLHAKTWIFDDTMAVIGSANFNRRGLSHDGELGVGVVDLDKIRGGWVHELRMRLWLKHLPTQGRPVTKDQVTDFEMGRTLWVDTPDTFLTPMNIAAGEPSQPDHLIVCEQPADGIKKRFVRACACDLTALRVVMRNQDHQWDLAIDPDGT